MIQGMTGLRYDAVTQELIINSHSGDFTAFISTATGFGNAGIKNGKPFIKPVYGEITVKKFVLQ